MPGKACGAKTRSGGRCKTAGMENGRCRMHGGPTPSGFKHGRHSKLLKEIPGLTAHYERALADPDLLRLDAESRARRRAHWRPARAHREGEGERRDVDGIWPQLEALIDARRKLVVAESSRMKDLHAMVSVDRVMTLVATSPTRCAGT
jgi:hypothetical protein